MEESAVASRERGTHGRARRISGEVVDGRAALRQACQLACITAVRSRILAQRFDVRIKDGVTLGALNVVQDLVEHTCDAQSKDLQAHAEDIIPVSSPVGGRPCRFFPGRPGRADRLSVASTHVQSACGRYRERCSRQACPRHAQRKEGRTAS